MIHAEDPDIRYLLIERWQERDPEGSLVSWAYANPNILEPLQLAQAAWIAEEVGIPVYMVHVSSHEAVEMIREFKQKGWRTVGETLTAFLYWTADEADARGVGAKGKVQPAIKFGRDRDALWQGIRDGTITQIGTDHLMYTQDAVGGNFWDKRVGLGPGLGTSLPAIITAGLNRNQITLEQMARVMAENVARQYDLYPAKGVLQPGSDADIVVFDPSRRRVAIGEELHSASKYTIFEGEESVRMARSRIRARPARRRRRRDCRSGAVRALRPRCRRPSSGDAQRPSPDESAEATRRRARRHLIPGGSRESRGCERDRMQPRSGARGTRGGGP